MEIFSNRELATFIWIIILSIFALKILTKKQHSKNSLKTLFKCIFYSKLTPIFILTIIYTYIIIKLLHSNNDLNNSDIKSDIKNAILYIIVIALPLVYHIVGTPKKQITKKLIVNSLSISGIYSFYISLISYSIIVELILFPITLLLSLIIVFTQTKLKYLEAKRLSFIMLSLIIIIAFYNTSIEIYNNSNQYINIKTLITFIFPIIYSICLIPFLYLIQILVLYETLIIRFKVLLPKNLLFTGYWQLIKNSKLSREQLIKFDNTSFKELYKTITKDNLIKYFQNQ